MPLFFCISGYVYCIAYYDSDNSPKYHNILTQAANLAVTYVIFAVGFTLLKIPFNAISNEPASLSDIIWMWKRPVGIYWYLYVLIGMYIIFAMPCFAKAKSWIIIVASTICSVLSYYISIPFPALNSVLNYYLIFFASGIVYARSKKTFSYPLLTVAGIICSIVLSIIFWNNDIRLDNVHYVNLMIAFGFVSFVWYVFEHIGIIGNSKILQFLGLRSLEIYVTHGIFVTAGRTFLNRLSIENQYICLVINLCLGVGFPILFSLVVRKMHLFDWLFSFASMVSKVYRMKNPGGKT